MPIDLRSDTVTRPTPSMRRAMAEAEVGDDVFGEDPTVRQLEEEVAGLLGKEAGLFVPSGVMGNQIALRLHTRPGDEVILAERSHIFHYEGGGPAALSGLQLRPVGGLSGILTPDDVDAAVRGPFDWDPQSRLLALENTVNKAGGAVYTPEQTRAAADAARRHGLAVHLDGARLWNAAVALGLPEADLAAPADTVNVCLSKGLGAPVGSVLTGPAPLMREARRVRKLLGGGMRQVGILAAAGLHALRHHRAGLAADHARARAFADALERTGAVRVIPPQTNIVLFDLDEPAEAAIARLDAAGVRVTAFGPRTLRAIFHLDVDDAGLEQAVEVVTTVFSAD